jgi:hypothetical protein
MSRFRSISVKIFNISRLQASSRILALTEEKNGEPWQNPCPTWQGSNSEISTISRSVPTLFEDTGDLLEILQKEQVPSFHDTEGATLKYFLAAVYRSF